VGKGLANLYTQDMHMEHSPNYLGRVKMYASRLPGLGQELPLPSFIHCNTSFFTFCEEFDPPIIGGCMNILPKTGRCSG